MWENQQMIQFRKAIRGKHNFHKFLNSFHAGLKAGDWKRVSKWDLKASAQGAVWAEGGEHRKARS